MKDGPHQIGFTCYTWSTATAMPKPCSRRSARALTLMIDQSHTDAVATRNLHAMAMDQRGDA